MLSIITTTMISRPFITARRLLMAAAFICFSFSFASADTVALLVGNNDYKHIRQLRNPINDVAGIGKKFKAAGVVHEVVTDATRGDMEDALDRLRLASTKASVVMLYFAGHGIELNGKNYLLPTGARLTSSSQLATEAISLDQILKRLGQCGMSSRFLVLDCCRDNPFVGEKWLGGYTGGLAPVEKSDLPSDTVVIYSGAPGKTVPDGVGDNSPFASEVITQLQSGKSAFNVFFSVASSIKSGQKPWLEFNGEFEQLGPLLIHPLLGKPLPTGEVNLSLLLRLFESSGQEIEDHFQKDGMQNSLSHQRFYVARKTQLLRDLANIYMPDGYYGPKGMEAYLSAEVAVFVNQQEPDVARTRLLEMQALAMQTFEGEMVGMIVKRSLSEDKAAAWLEDNGFDY